MKTSTLKCLMFAALSVGSIASLATASHAAMTATEFLASLDDLKRVCHRIEEPLWIKKHNYGCGQKIVCAEGHCVAKKRRVVIILRPERPHLTPVRPVRPIESPIYPFGESKSGGKDAGSSDSGGSGGGEGRGSSVGTGAR